MFHGNKKKEKKPLTEEETKGIEDKLNKIKLIIPNFPFKIYANNKEVY